MSRPLRTACAALFLMSLFSMASCNRNWCDDYYCSPCATPCSSLYDPYYSGYSSSYDCNPGPCAAPITAPCQPSPQCEPSCAPSCQPPCGPCDFGGVYNNPMQECGYPVSSGPQACAPESNPYYPCDPSFFPCGNGPCNNAAPVERCYGQMNTYQTCDDCVVDLVQRAPEFATVGSPYPVEILITSRKECADVVVNQTLPCGSEFLRSDPPATPDQYGALHWEFAHMNAAETQRICVWLRPLKEGCCLAAATVCACPQLCAYTNCVQPVLCIRKWGPECACLYCPVNYTIEVCNSGSGTAYGVMVTDNLPDGLTHSSGLNCLSYQLGDLAPGESRQICLELCATGAGCVTNVATVTYCGGPRCSAEWSTLINQPCVEVTKTGPDWAYICKVVDYTITVTNPGDLVLRNVRVDDVSPMGTTIVDAPGAEICCNRAIWCLPELCPGETKTLYVSVSSQVPGCLTNKVTVTTDSDCGQCTSCAEAVTCWKGIPAVHMCMVDTADPICIGQTTVYRICVTNRGSAEDSNVGLELRFTNELEPQSANGPTRAMVSGQSVRFEPLDRLAPKQSVEYCVVVKGVAVGDARAEAILSSDALSTPVIDTESTHVY